MEEQNLNDAHSEVALENKPIEIKRTSHPIPNIVQTVLVLLCLLCLVLVYLPYDNGLEGSIHRAGLVYTAYYAPIIHHSVVILNRLIFNVQTDKTTEQINSIIFGSLLLGASCIAISDWRGFVASPYHHPPKLFMDMMITSGVFAVFSSFLAFIYVYALGVYS